MSKGCIACDFDKTLAFHVNGQQALGNPIPKMLRRIKQHLVDGEDVEIFSARADNPKSIEEIEDWTEKHLGVRLNVGNIKKPNFYKFYDDKAVEVEPNTGRLRGERAVTRRRLKLSR